MLPGLKVFCYKRVVVWFRSLTWQEKVVSLFILFLLVKMAGAIGDYGLIVGLVFRHRTQQCCLGVGTIFLAVEVATPIIRALIKEDETFWKWEALEYCLYVLVWITIWILPERPARVLTATEFLFILMGALVMVIPLLEGGSSLVRRIWQSRFPSVPSEQ